AAASLPAPPARIDRRIDGSLVGGTQRQIAELVDLVLEAARELAVAARGQREARRLEADDQRGAGRAAPRRPEQDGPDRLVERPDEVVDVDEHRVALAEAPADDERRHEDR